LQLFFAHARLLFTGVENGDKQHSLYPQFVLIVDKQKWQQRVAFHNHLQCFDLSGYMGCG
jgi:hypothetical protein